jgi:hypothetical protein
MIVHDTSNLYSNPLKEPNDNDRNKEDPHHA